MKNIPKRYSPSEYEKRWADHWIEEEVFSSRPDKRKAYSIVIPPPNVTGVLHMGHALNNSLQDILIRAHKMMGFNTMWMPGTDHGGIATQNVVEKLLYDEGKTRHDLGRDMFLERMWNWKEESGGTIISQLKRIGCGCDWKRLRFTMDEQCSRAVKEAFFRLFEDGLIYRGLRMTNWCPRCHTALADIEVEHEEKDSSIWYIKYPLADEEGYLTVATTRPETMLGDTAVAVNPEDKRYKDVVGKYVELPLTGRRIPVVADEFVDMEFGTGCVKVTPEHDPNDAEIGERHNLDEKIGRYVIIDRDGSMTDDVPEAYRGLDRFECRKKVVADLKELDLLEKTEDYRHAVGVCYRCSTVIEPLKTRQWFLKMGDMAREAAAATREGRIQLFPNNWGSPYLQWLDNIHDWCLSRQIWWGHRIPIWYCGSCGGSKIFISFNDNFYDKHEGSREWDQSYSALREHLSHEEIIDNADSIYMDEGISPIVATGKPESCPSCGAAELIQDPDVLDTWFSSALWPFSTLGWPEDTEDIEFYYPTDVLVTGHEILYLWVARMVMMGLKLKGDIPFGKVFIHGIVRDEHGNKMSKSKGNVIDPIEIIDEYGTDALRFSLAKSAVPGRDMQLSKDDFVGARNFCNKLWNATRLILSSLEIDSISIDTDRLELADKWILSEADRFTREIKESYLSFNNGQAARLGYEFTWSYFCDWYLEIAKLRLYSDAEVKSRTVQAVLVKVLVRILGLLHPVMPFITSQLWEFIASEITSLPENILEYNAFEDTFIEISMEDLENMNIIMDIVNAVRNIRGENSIQPSVKLASRLKVPEGKVVLIEKYTDYLKILAGLDSIDMGPDVERQAGDAASVAGDISIFTSMPKELRDREIQRLTKKVEEMKQQVNFANKKLRNRDFISKAPERVVEKAKKRAEELEMEFSRLENNLQAIKNPD